MAYSFLPLRVPGAMFYAGDDNTVPGRSKRGFLKPPFIKITMITN